MTASDQLKYENEILDIIDHADEKRADDHCHERRDQVQRHAPTRAQATVTNEELFQRFKFQGSKFQGFKLPLSLNLKLETCNLKLFSKPCAVRARLVPCHANHGITGAMKARIVPVPRTPFRAAVRLHPSPSAPPEA